jgi:putative GTP pyrophosphokinase
MIGVPTRHQLAKPVSKGEINRAGDTLRRWWAVTGDGRRAMYPAGSEAWNEVVNALAVLIYDFRTTFERPLKRVDAGVRNFASRESAGQPRVGQRLKREMQIVHKLTRHRTMNLSQMQDIGGCRAVMPGGLDEVYALEARIRKNWESAFRGYKDYIKKPTQWGYRAIHIVVLKDERLIEIQLRTSAQHEWAIAVERWGHRLGYDLKFGRGPADLLRYFEQAAYGMALEERGEGPDEAFERDFAELREQVRPYFLRT